MIAHREWDCRALGRRQAYTVAIPDAPAPEGGWPLVLLLHGAGRHHRTVVDNVETRAAVERTPAVVAMPDGALGFWTDSPAGDYRTMLDELLVLLRDSLPVSPLAARTAIGGWSMGGYGAIAYAQHRPGAVGTAATAIGLLDFPQPELPATENYPVPELFGGDPAAWARHNCCVNAERLRGLRLAVFAARQAFDWRMNQHFHQRLDRLGIAHRWEEADGGHDWPAVAAAMPRLLGFLAGSD